jgi:cytochrome c-type biogenesis protein CcmH/NrfG
MLEEFLAADPADIFSRYALALELEKEQRMTEAIAELRDVISRDGGYVAAYYHLGRLLARQGQEGEAREVYRTGLDVAAKAGDRRTRDEIQEAMDSLD